MNIYSDDTSVLRTHYYLSKTKQSAFTTPIYLGNSKKAYIHKECRGFLSNKFTHVNFLALFRVLAFSYMRFKCTNINILLKKAKESLLLPAEQSMTTKPGCYVVNEKGLITFDAFVYYYAPPTLSADNVRRMNVWPIDKPNIEYIEGNDNNILFNYDTSRVELHHFVKYVNSTFKSNISTVLQNPIHMIHKELNVKYNMYKIFNNIQLLSHDLFPSLYDFLVAQSILDYIDNGCGE
ncbi:hypothetical protein QKT26_gp50 [Carcinus maenas nudivirus]|uniref:Uncharacterized protein n=1 Tax=Carcinus maenas nudivirus TaxID=2880837 RepID=A0AAE8Y0G8_9VIRU|nr:hypothetical protein QKT26_gp50 [Carcinus maenas nudivirus]UBZ25640.1 hypothetical protein CmNV_049 [Carcinus maenas nudivirus]